jgi:hypothetical protein
MVYPPGMDLESDFSGFQGLKVKSCLVLQGAGRGMMGILGQPGADSM